MASGRAALRAGDLQVAVEEFGQTVVLAPEWLEAIEAHAEALDMVGDTVRSAAEYDRLRRLRATVRSGPPDRGYVLRHRGQFTSEVWAYGLVACRIDKLVFPTIARGNAFLADGHPAEAVMQYDRALRLKPGLLTVQSLRAEALSASGRFRDAVAGFDKVLSANKDDVEALSGRAIARMALGKVADANATWLRQFDLLAPQHAAARGCVALRMADYARALPEMERAVASNAADPYWALYRLTSLSRLGLPVETFPSAGIDAWPGPLLALHAGRTEEAAVLALADTPGRRTEVDFQLGVLAAPTDREMAKRRWQAVVEQGPAHFIEYAAARNELARLGP